MATTSGDSIRSLISGLFVTRCDMESFPGLVRFDKLEIFIKFS